MTSNSPYKFNDYVIFSAWESDDIIENELWRNIGLSISAVIVVTFIFLCNIQVCVMVVFMVTISLVDIVGFLHFWNITIDVISCISIVLSIGLCVDYSVHIGHGYLVARGRTNQERTNNAVVFIGPAVFNGGFTTFLALVLCSFSTGLQNCLELFYYMCVSFLRPCISYSLQGFYSDCIFWTFQWNCFSSSNTFSYWPIKVTNKILQ